MRSEIHVCAGKAVPDDWFGARIVSLLKFCCADCVVIFFNTVANGRQMLSFRADCLPPDEEC